MMVWMADRSRAYIGRGKKMQGICDLNPNMGNFGVNYNGSDDYIASKSTHHYSITGTTRGG